MTQNEGRGGAQNTFFSVTLYNFQKGVCGGRGAQAPPPPRALVTYVILSVFIHLVAVFVSLIGMNISICYPFFRKKNWQKKKNIARVSKT